MTFNNYSKGLGDNDRFEFRNLNPDNRCTCDCSTRTIAAALGIGYEEAIDLQCAEAKRGHFGLTSNETMIAVLEAHGFTGHKIGAAARGHRRDSVGDIAERYADKVCVIHAAGHFTFASGGKVYDTWNCTKKTAYGVWYK